MPLIVKYGMDGFLRKLLVSLQKNGIIGTLLRIVRYPLVRVVQRWRTRKQRDFSGRVLLLPSMEERFTWIYQNNFWGSEESVSGTGSTLRYTENLRKALPEIFRAHSIRRVFDAPCGDFNWMSHLLTEVDIKYTGGDIVAPLVERHRAKFGGASISFVHIDLTRDPFPNADLMICRDCLFHLSYEDTFRVLEGFLGSGIPYLLTSTHGNDGQFENHDIKTGDFRLIDLYSAPYCFPGNPLVVIDDWLPPDPERYMCLWTRDQVAQAVAGTRLQRH